MTDNEIVKALECCTTNGASCKDCPAFVRVDRSNCKKYFRGALDLIVRLKAEIEKRKSDFKLMQECARYFENKYETAKAEAIKEFADRLKKSSCQIDGGKYCCVVIDNLVKEMVGDE